MGSYPFFSVIVSTFNRSRFIVPTIKSALWQSYPHFEVLVIGDGCTDDTATVLKQHFGRRVFWHNLKSNHGSQSYPNNEGIKLARGSHVAYLGHDDVWSPEHLATIAKVIKRHDSDFVIAGAIYHMPSGAGAPLITGLVVDQVKSARHFFPPSSWAHRRSVLAKLGGWPDPESVIAPADCHLILRAREESLSFESTGAITVHKFAAGHRYLSYLFPSDTEQTNMMKVIAKRSGENRVLSRILAEAMAGMIPAYSLIPTMDNFAPGSLHRRSLACRGVNIDDRMDLKAFQRFFPGDGPAALDWHPLERDPIHGPFRWSGPNPNPVWFLNIRCAGPISFVVHILDFAKPSHAEKLRIEVNDVKVAITAEVDDQQLRFAGVTSDGPIANGLKLRFRLPSSVKGSEGRRVGFRLHCIDVVPHNLAPALPSAPQEC